MQTTGVNASLLVLSMFYFACLIIIIFTADKLFVALDPRRPRREARRVGADLAFIVLSIALLIILYYLGPLALTVAFLVPWRQMVEAERREGERERERILRLYSEHAEAIDGEVNSDYATALAIQRSWPDGHGWELSTSAER